MYKLIAREFTNNFYDFDTLSCLLGVTNRENVYLIFFIL